MHKRAGLIVLVFAFCIQWGVAQTTGTISGTVRDATGGVVPGAAVIVRNVETGLSRTLSTDAQGRYQAPNLSVGQYEVEVSLSGFQTEVRKGIGLTVAQEAVINFQLQVGQVAERVEVTGEAPLVEASNATITGLVDQNTIQDLPLNGRSFSELLRLQVGTSFARQDRGDDTRGGGAKISISGAKPGANSFLLDGTDINDSRSGVPGGASGFTLGVETVREFRVLTNSYSAEYGRASGGVLTAVTKSGTNDLHGSVFEFLRNDKLDASSWEDTARGTGEKPPFKRNQFGLSLGGPIRKNQTFFFGSYEGLRDRLGGTNTIDVPTERTKAGCMPLNGDIGGREVCIGDPAFAPASAATLAAIKPWLAFYPPPNGPILDKRDGTGEFSYVTAQPTDHDYFTLRGDHSFSPSHSMFVRYTLDDSEKPAPSRPLPDRRDAVVRNHYLTAQYDSVLSPTVLNTARFGMNRSTAQDISIYADSFDLNGMAFVPGVPFDRGGVFGVDGIEPIGDGNVPRGVHFKLFEGSDDLTLVRGSHTLKTGFLFKRVFDFQEAVSGQAGDIDFDGLWEALQGKPNELELDWPGFPQERDWSQNFVGAYLQDDFKWKPNFSLNLGVRLEFMTGPMEANGRCADVTDVFQQVPPVRCPFFETFKNNWAPRVGFAWDTGSNSKLVVRGGFGLFYDQPFSTYWKSAGRSNPPLSLVVAIPNPPFPNPTAGQDFSRPPNLPPDVRGWKYTGTSYVMQYNFNIQSEIRPGTGVTLGYIGSQGRKISITMQKNTPPWVILQDGRKRFTNVNDLPRNAPIPLLSPLWSSLLLASSEANSSHNAAVFSLNQRFRAGLRTQLSYTYGKTMSISDTISGSDFRGGDSGSGTMDGYNPGRDRGVATYSLRHSLSINYSYDFPFRGVGWTGKLIQGWQLSGIVSRQSGIPFSVTTSYDPDSRSTSTVRWGLLRPNLVAGKSNKPIIGGPDRYFDPSAFTMDLNGNGVVTDTDDRGFFGNLGRNTLTGPGLVNFDFSLLKNTAITERINLQFRAEFFNFLNHPNFKNPDGGLFDSRGRPELESDSIRIDETSTRPRQVQFGLKIIF